MTFPSKIDVMKFKNKRSCTSVTNMHIEKKNEQIFAIKRNKKNIYTKKGEQKKIRRGKIKDIRRKKKNTGGKREEKKRRRML